MASATCNLWRNSVRCSLKHNLFQIYRFLVRSNLGRKTFFWTFSQQIYSVWHWVWLNSKVVQLLCEADRQIVFLEADDFSQNLILKMKMGDCLKALQNDSTHLMQFLSKVVRFLWLICYCSWIIFWESRDNWNFSGTFRFSYSFSEQNKLFTN